MASESAASLASWIKARASEMGFAACGISTVAYLEEEEPRMDRWLREGMHGEMSYMERNREKRLDPGLLVDGARSVISFMYNYYPGTHLTRENNLSISKYAYGKDYHLVIRDKLHQLIRELKALAGDFHARPFTDSAPVLERAWARRSGLGWIGKNTCLIHPKLGSYYFLAEIITDLEIEADTDRVNDLCGGCTRCIDSCPTGAIVAPGVLDSRKCISYLTIEYRGELPGNEREKFGDMIFGCDICQDACPWNRFTTAHQEEQFEPGEELLQMDRDQWTSLTREKFKELFGESAVRRTGFEGLKRNIDFVAGDHKG